MSIATGAAGTVSPPVGVDPSGDEFGSSAIGTEEPGAGVVGESGASAPTPLWS